MVRGAMVVLLLTAVVTLCTARPVHDFHSLLSLGVSQGDVTTSGPLLALLTLQAAEVEYGHNVSVMFQRIVEESADIRKNDFIGLYEKTDNKAFDPWNWELISTNNTGSISLEANRVGNLEFRLVRPPMTILASVPIKVFPPCIPDCYAHGNCVKGECVCHVGYLLPDCSSPDPLSLRIEPVKPADGSDIQVNTPINVRLWHLNNVVMNGKDYIGIYPAESQNGTKALSWKTVKGKLPQVIQLPSIATKGDYVIRVTRRSDLQVLLQSQAFSIHEYCPRKCTDHGKCIAGMCVCDAPWTSADCSVGPDLVQLQVLWPTVNQQELVRNEEISVQFNRTLDARHPDILTDADWIGMYAAGDENVTEPFAYQYAQMDPSSTESEFQIGRVAFFTPPAGADSFVFKYVRNDHVVLATTQPVPVHKPCDPEDCNGHGDCDDGVCVCEAGWTGSTCSIGDVKCEISFKEDNLIAGEKIAASVSTGVGTATTQDFIGLYADTSFDNTKGLFSFQNLSTGAVTDNTFAASVTVVPPSSGAFSLRAVDIFTKATICETPLFHVYSRCPKDCSNKGKCVKGVCECSGGHLAPDCQREAGSILVASSQPRVSLGNDFTKNTEIEFVVSKPSGWYDAGDFVGIYPLADSTNPVTVMMVLAYTAAPQNSGDSTLKLNVSSAVKPGKYVLWYVKGMNYEKWAESEPFELVPDCNQGTYNLNTNKCECPEDKTGPRCEADTCCYALDVAETHFHPKDKLSVTWARPHKNGRDSDLIALYLGNATDFSAPYAYQFAVADADGDHGVAVLDMPPMESAYVLHYIASSDMSSRLRGPEVAVTLPCDPEDCNGHGACLSGRCVCSFGFGGLKCDKTVPETTFVTLETQGPITKSQVLSVKWGRLVEDGARGDYLGVYAINDAAGAKPLGYAYVPFSPEQFQGTLTLVAPNTRGTYEIRWASGLVQGTFLARSAAFEIAA